MTDETLLLHMASVVTYEEAHGTSSLPLEQMFENEQAARHVNMPDQIYQILCEVTVPCAVVSDIKKYLSRLLRNGRPFLTD